MVAGHFMQQALEPHTLTHLSDLTLSSCCALHRVHCSVTLTPAHLPTPTPSPITSPLSRISVPRFSVAPSDGGSSCSGSDPSSDWSSSSPSLVWSSSSSSSPSLPEEVWSTAVGVVSLSGAPLNSSAATTYIPCRDTHSDIQCSTNLSSKLRT